jgi:hypothetical protein
VDKAGLPGSGLLCGKKGPKNADRQTLPEPESAKLIALIRQGDVFRKHG